MKCEYIVDWIEMLVILMTRLDQNIFHVILSFKKNAYVAFIIFCMNEYNGREQQSALFLRSFY